jgi:hypothetical protein
MGRTGITRKSTAYRFGLNVMADAGKLLDGKAVPLYGLASIEGLAAFMVADAPPPNRVLCVLDEFKSLATKNKQKAVSNLIPGLTDLFNTGSALEVNTKAKRVAVENPFFCMLAASTQAWFEESLSQSDVSGGFLNRWLVFGGEPKKLIPFPKGVDPQTWTAFIGSIADAVKLARGEYLLTPEAGAVYECFYEKFHHGAIEGIGTSEATARTDLHAMKLALLYAVLAKHEKIEREDIESGIALSVYSAKMIGPVAQRLGRSPQADLEARILDALKDGPLTNREVYRKLHASAGHVGFATKALEAVGTIRNSNNKLELIL